jgi:hypothetical protein
MDFFPVILRHLKYQIVMWVFAYKYCVPISKRKASSCVMMSSVISGRKGEPVEPKPIKEIPPDPLWNDRFLVIKKRSWILL